MNYSLLALMCSVLQVLYNYAYALHMMGETGAAKEKLETAKAQAASTSESRHNIITAALDTIRVRGERQREGVWLGGKGWG